MRRMLHPRWMDACSKDDTHDLQETRMFYMEIISTILERIVQKRTFT